MNYYTLGSRLEEAKQLAINRLLRPNFYGNVVGIGTGRKLRDGEVTETRCVRVYVQSKIDLDDLSLSVQVPPSFLDVPTDIIKIGLMGRPGPRPREAGTPRPGFPIRLRTNSPNVNPDITGTLGAVVKDAGGKKYILSCNHVLAANGRFKNDAGQNVTGQNDTGARIVAADFSGSERPIGRPFAFIELRLGQENSVDCALAHLDDDEVSGKFPSNGVLPEPIPPDRGMRVEKTGAVTGSTSGIIVDVNADLFIDYTFGTFRFSNQVIIDGLRNNNFAADGDSGAIVVDMATRRPAAMIFAEFGRFAVACPLSKALEQLEKAIGSTLSLVVEEVASTYASKPATYKGRRRPVAAAG